MNACKNRHILITKKTPDVTLVIDNVEFPAHRAILSEGSEYFKTMFSSSFFEAKADKVLLKETNLDAFKFVFEYIYTRSACMYKSLRFTLKEKFETLSCARFYMVDQLVTDAISIIKDSVYLYNLVELLNYATIYSFDEFIPFIEAQIRANPICTGSFINAFEQLSPLAVKRLLKLKYYLLVQESTLFKALVRCIRLNTHYSYPILQLLEHIELHLLTENELDLLFEPTILIDHTSCLKLLHQQREQAEKVTKIVNLNVIKSFDDLRVIRGKKYLKQKTVTNGNECYIDIDLKHLFLLNCIKLKLGKLAEDKMSYTVMVSKDMHTWCCIADYSSHKCFGPQLLCFNERPVRFIRIEACPFDYTSEFCLDGYIEALYSTDPMEIDPNSTFLIPKRPLLAQDLKLLTGDCYLPLPPSDRYTDNNMIFQFLQPSINDKLKPVRSDRYTGNEITFQLPQPCIIDSMKLWFDRERSYNIDIATTEKWIRVFSEDTVIGWRIATFKKQPVSYIKITSKATFNSTFCFEGLKLPAI